MHVDTSVVCISAPYFWLFQNWLRLQFNLYSLKNWIWEFRFNNPVFRCTYIECLRFAIRNIPLILCPLQLYALAAAENRTFLCVQKSSLDIWCVTSAYKSLIITMFAAINVIVSIFTVTCWQLVCITDLLIDSSPPTPLIVGNCNQRWGFNIHSLRCPLAAWYASYIFRWRFHTIAPLQFLTLEKRGGTIPVLIN